MTTRGENHFYKVCQKPSLQDLHISNPLPLAESPFQKINKKLKEEHLLAV